MLAIELGRRGVAVEVVERRRTRLRHPRAIGLHSRTMEILRQLGWADEVRAAAGLPLEQWSSFGYMTRLKEPDIGAVDILADPERVERAYQQSPEMLAWCAQDVFEPFLSAKAAEFPSVSIRAGVRAVGLQQDDDEVRLTIEVTSEQADQPHTEQIRARYLAGADGAHSMVREMLGVPTVTSPSAGYQLNACFTADLSRDLLPFLADLEDTFVIDHMGYMTEHDPDFERRLLAILAQGSCWIKLSGAYRVAKNKPLSSVASWGRALVAARPDRLLWGSDWPHLPDGQRDTGEILNLLADWAPAGEARQAILVDGPDRLFFS